MARPKIDYMVPVTTAVVHQKLEGSCVKIVLADMLTIILRMNGDDSDTECDLTPQIGIDRDGGILDCIDMCTLPQFGLEKTDVYPWCIIPRDVKEWTEEEYETQPDERKRLQDIRWVDEKDSVPGKLIQMFGEGGDGYPVGGIMVMGEFGKNHIALAHATGPPFRHAADADLSGTRHAMLIVGLNTMSDREEEHYCVVKSSYGEKWGNRGYSRVAIDQFVELLYPVQPRGR